MRNKYKLYLGVLVAVIIAGSGLGYASFQLQENLMQLPVIKTLTKLGENNNTSNNSESQNSQGNQGNQGNQITQSNNGNGSDDNFIPEPNIQSITGNFLPVITQNSKQLQIIEKKPKFTAIKTCSNCQGTGQVTCTNPECENGIMKWSWKPGDPGHGFSVQCEVCHGTGKVTCPVCKGAGEVELTVITKNIIDPNKIRG